MDVFGFCNRLIADYADYISSFIRIQDPRIDQHVQQSLDSGWLWPDPLIQLNPSFEAGNSIDELVREDLLHPMCSRIFRIRKSQSNPEGQSLLLYRHQSAAIRTARRGHNYVLTTGTGSGKSLAYIIPIVDHVLRSGSGRGIQAIVVYPMNALANSQEGELKKFLCYGFPDNRSPVTFARYTGQEKDEIRDQITRNPPDILLTNYVMLELILTRPYERRLIDAAKGLQFLVLDELHTYRGRQGADVAMLVRRTRESLQAESLKCIGTSATLAGPGTHEEQRAEVARVASLLFGADVLAEDVIGETVRRATRALHLDDPNDRSRLTARVAGETMPPSTDYEHFIEDPLSSWIETTFGIEPDDRNGRLRRATPKTITGESGGAHLLSKTLGLPEDRCRRAIEQGLLAGYETKQPETGFPVFAFKLHQFISRGDTVYGSLEPEEQRHITLQPQHYVPGSRHRVLLPLVFCRECGQEYYCVRKRSGQDGHVFEPRELLDRSEEDHSEPGFLYLNTKEPWPSTFDDLIERLPDDWLETRKGTVVIRKNIQEILPRAVTVTPEARVADGGLECHYLPAPFRLCLNCGVAYEARQRSDAAKLSSLALGGRSTATTILSLSAIQHLKREEYLEQRACKLLSFTDNRQDASLQAGHFNDFVEIGLLRSALYRAAKGAGPDGLEHDALAQRVFDALGLPIHLYASDPEVRYHNLEETKRALRDVLGYRLYRDLQRGWRITSPNLEQCGLLVMRYLSLDEVCADQTIWKRCHRVLANAGPPTRSQAATILLDYVRRELAIKVSYLTSEEQDRMKQRSSQRLTGPWAFDESERMEAAPALFPRGRQRGDYGGNIYLSPRGGFGQYLRRRTTFPDVPEQLKLVDSEVIARQLLEGLRKAGIVEIVEEPRGEDGVPGYQLVAGAMKWVASDGSRGYHDPIRVPRAPAKGMQANKFFVKFYQAAAAEMVGLHAREHTAQVPNEEREEREHSFREGRLPILYCSPTMELGVDIAELNVVNLRNVPPTPANYAQRSGRAGRSGQPALVFSYCSTGSSHDQYFFKRPALMVSGAVSPPQLDLANEDLVRAHVQAIWLAETRQDLGKSLRDILDVSGEAPSLALLDSVRVSVEDQGARDRAYQRARRTMDSIKNYLRQADWYSEDWLREIIQQVAHTFDVACQRWRGLYRSARNQYDTQTRISADVSRPQEERDRARRLRREAEAQLDLLAQSERAIQSDFYSYRYFASEGFLPGYSFPRLPLSAFIPGRRGMRGRDEYLSRPRFLAISEFGPRGIVYHEGSQYMIHKVILPAESEETLLTQAKQCEACGYFHPLGTDQVRDLCERCHQPLGSVMGNLFRLQNVSTKRRAKINSDEEERVRLGYELKTGVRFAEPGGRPSCRIANVEVDGQIVIRLSYGHAASLWRINLGWSRREDKNQQGFLLDLERGYWASNKEMEEDDEEDPMSPRRQRVIPYVEDRRNCLLVDTHDQLTGTQMASLEAALKVAIQVEFQLEDNELASEPLPSRDDRRLILLYESAEGGAGVLRRLLDDPQAMVQVAKRALEVCHFDPETGADQRRAPRSKEDCEAACYDCLMSYGNQREHRLLDRKTIQQLLLRLTTGTVEASPSEIPRAEHLQGLLQQTHSHLEKQWLQLLEERALHLPSEAQKRIAACQTKPDFFYQESQSAIYVDGPPHDFPERQDRDTQQTECMEDNGYTVIRFHHADDWVKKIERFPHVFGRI